MFEQIKLWIWQVSKAAEAFELLEQQQSAGQHEQRPEVVCSLCTAHPTAAAALLPAKVKYRHSSAALASPPRICSAMSSASIDNVENFVG